MMANAAFDKSGEMHVATTMSNICEIAVSRCCHRDFKPLPPTLKWTATHCLDLPFECTGCGEHYVVKTGKHVRLRLDADELTDSDEDDEEDRPLGRTARGHRKQKKRKLTNSRPLEVAQDVMACLATGVMYNMYAKRQSDKNSPFVHHSTFDRYIGKMMRHIDAVARKSVDLMRYLVVKYGSIDKLLLTHDHYWQTRGHHSDNGTGTVCDYDSGEAAERDRALPRDPVGRAA